MVYSDEHSVIRLLSHSSLKRIIKLPSAILLFDFEDSAEKSAQDELYEPSEKVFFFFLNL